MSNKKDLYEYSLVQKKFTDIRLQQIYFIQMHFLNYILVFDFVNLTGKQVNKTSINYYKIDKPAIVQVD